MKDFAELKELISEKIEELQDKLKETQNELNLYTRILIKIDSILEKESFKTAAELYEAEPKEIKEEISPKKIKEPTEEPIIDREIEIRSSEDKIIGKMMVEKNNITISPINEISIPENAAPFKSFFLGRILKQMEEEDEEDIKNRNLDADEKITYEIIKSAENNVKKIIIKNYRSYNRMIKINDTISWTFRTILKQK